MIVLAKAFKGSEFYYNWKTAHKVSKKNAAKIRDELNRVGFELDQDTIWHIYNVDEYDRAYSVGETRSFRIRSGKIVEIR